MEDQLLMSLRSAVLEKLNKEQREVMDNLSCEVQSLESTEKDLLERASNLEIIRAEMISELVRWYSSFEPHWGHIFFPIGFYKSQKLLELHFQQKSLAKV